MYSAPGRPDGATLFEEDARPAGTAAALPHRGSPRNRKWNQQSAFFEPTRQEEVNMEPKAPETDESAHQQRPFTA